MKCEYRQLGDVAIQFIDGDRGKNYPSNNEFSNVGYCLFLNAKNVTPDGFSFGEVSFITQKKDAMLRKGKLEKNDVVLTTRGTVGNVAFYGERVLYSNVRINSGMLIIRPDPSVFCPEYVYWLFRSDVIQDQIKRFRSGTAQPQLPISSIKKFEIPLVDIKTQEKIAAILSALDEKIATNRAINDNLEQQAAALFESWFVDYNPWSGIQPSEWTNAPLGTFVEIKRGGSPRPIQDYLSDSGLRWLKISDVTSLSSPFVLEIKEHIKEEGLKKTVFLHAGELVLSNSATPGIPKILDVDTCIHDGWLYFPKSELSKYYLYLFFKHIRKELVSLGNGSVFTNLKTDILKAFPATKADKVTLKKFDALVSPLFDAMLNADRENLKLATMRDSLLPKLMSGEIDVSAIQL